KSFPNTGGIDSSGQYPRQRISLTGPDSSLQDSDSSFIIQQFKIVFNLFHAILRIFRSMFPCRILCSQRLSSEKLLHLGNLGMKKHFLNRAALKYASLLQKMHPGTHSGNMAEPMADENPGILLFPVNPADHLFKIVHTVRIKIG